MGDQVTDANAITKSVRVRAPVEAAFRVFTERIGEWWPLETHSVADDAATCVFEGREGGRFFERTASGQEHMWGTVTVYEPPTHLVYTWHPGRGEETSQEVEMWFRSEGEGTRVDVEHRGWERYGEGLDKALRSYDTGWDFVLGDRFAEAATRR